MNEENIKIALDTDPQLARLIIETAEYLAKAPPKEWTICQPGELKYNYVRPTPEHIREAADLVFLAMSLIAEKRQ